MHLSSNDQKLLAETDQSVLDEREATVRVLKNFLEIDRRRLYCALGKGSLKEFVMERYQFSEDEAWRRINAMKLLREIPQVEKKIESGALSMTHIGLAQSLFKHEKRNHDRVFSNEQKLQVLEKMEHTTTREAQKMTFALASSPMFKTEDRVRVVSQERVEIKFSAPTELEQKLNRLKGLLAHSHPNITMAELVDKLCELGIREWDPAQKVVKRDSSRTVKALASTAPAAKTRAVRVIPSAAPRPLRTAIPAQIKREVWKRDRSSCSNCGSRHALQVDHVRPVALGGDNNPENLRLLCRACNQRAAIQAFGVEKMQGNLFMT